MKRRRQENSSPDSKASSVEPLHTSVESAQKASKASSAEPLHTSVVSSDSKASLAEPLHTSVESPNSKASSAEPLHTSVESTQKASKASSAEPLHTPVELMGSSSCVESSQRVPSLALTHTCREKREISDIVSDAPLTRNQLLQKMEHTIRMGQMTSDNFNNFHELVVLMEKLVA